MTSTPRYVLFPGRHHLLTQFQADYLQRLADEGAETIVWAVTSANHENTKRNPIPYHRREAAIERFSVVTGLRSVVVPIFDTAPTDQFAEVTLKTVTVSTGLDLTPADTVVACSTPQVAALYEKLGFTIALVEAEPSLPAVPERPWDVLLRLAAGDDSWRKLAHPASVDVIDRYGLSHVVRTVVNDPVVGDEGGLTATRDYRTYVEAFADAAARKWTAVRQYVQPGRIVDIGCGAGAVLELADRDDALHESDLIGVEVARHLYQECVHKKAQGVFRNANVYFYQRNVLGGAVLPDRSVDTTLTFALTHEIWSYGQQRASLVQFAQRIHDHTVPGGVWINSDVCGPGDRSRPVLLRLTSDDGANPSSPRTDLASLASAEVAAYVGSLSTRARLDQFAVDFAFPFEYAATPDGDVRLPLGQAMDFLTRKDYTDNWLSETHEQFCGLDFSDWVELLAEAGFDLDPASHPLRNDWVIDNRIAPVASLFDEDGKPLDWPTTHAVIVARRPRNS
ncbi:class I SAM-dependent methyltransferase [Actinoplanes sp. LDG1-06]|uniref:Class I SAM-dependent methyltransferase n=1 Tax=Paractinoplanes ovalisporus TaxID=2810368 RepID=A0ABS2A2B6_9ACTN|nr:class I SAM-dependent methyltransferase [Actinoplanes ovalisporus]MBM2613989.1 class I SAM-dependent methyltransferase [Actinoplanes ovalisporus]